MVKVKVTSLTIPALTIASFNHPMVKVKGKAHDIIIDNTLGFNHPMVKVKDMADNVPDESIMFQPPYGES